MAKMFIPQFDVSGSLRIADFMHAAGFKIFGEKWKPTDISQQVQQQSLMLIEDGGTPAARKMVVQQCILQALANGEITAEINLGNLNWREIHYRALPKSPGNELLKRFFETSPPTLKSKADVRKKVEQILSQRPPPELSQTSASEEIIDDDDDDITDLDESDRKSPDQLSANKLTLLYESLRTFERVAALRVTLTVDEEFWQIAVGSVASVDTRALPIDWARSEGSIPLDKLVWDVPDLPRSKSHRQFVHIRRLPGRELHSRPPLVQPPKEYDEDAIIDQVKLHLRQKDVAYVLSIIEAKEAIEIIGKKPSFIDSSSWGSQYPEALKLDGIYLIAATWRVIAMELSATSMAKHGQINHFTDKLEDYLQTIYPQDRLPSRPKLLNIVTEICHQLQNPVSTSDILVKLGRTLPKGQAPKNNRKAAKKPAR